jgi:HK97 family phage prohead protease
MKGAFLATLKARQFRPLLWHHHQDQPIGIEKSLREDGKGLLGTWQLLESGPAVLAYEALKKGAVRAMSIGYIPQEVGFGDDDGRVRFLKSVDLLENSLVTLPMNAQAAVTGVKANYCISCGTSLKAEWTAAYINDLPDAAFAYIEAGGEKDSDGKTTPRSLRHFPHHGTDGDLDLPHLRNALARAPQSPFGEKALPHLQRHAKGEGVGGKDDDGDTESKSLIEQVDALTFSELAAFMAQVHDTFGEATRTLLARLGDDKQINESKRQELDILLGTFSGMDAVRSDAQRLLATANVSPAPAPVEKASNSALGLRIELRRRQLRAIGVEV